MLGCWGLVVMGVAACRGHQLTAWSLCVNIVLTCNEKATRRKSVESSGEQGLLKRFKHSPAELNFSWLSVC